MSIYSYSKEGVALACFLVRSAFDADTSALFSLVCARGVAGLPVTALASLRNAQRALVTLWRHGLIEYQSLALRQASTTATTSTKDTNSSTKETKESKETLLMPRDAETETYLETAARESHVIVARTDVAIWRARMFAHASLVPRLMGEPTASYADVADDDELLGDLNVDSLQLDGYSALGVVRRLLTHGSLSYQQLTARNASHDDLDPHAAYTPDDEKESVVTQLFLLGVIVERLPLDVEAALRRQVHLFLNELAPKARLDAKPDDAKLSGKKRSKAGGAAGKEGPAKKRALLERGAELADKLSDRPDWRDTANVLKAARFHIPREPAIVASGAALADDTIMPTFGDTTDDQLPLPLRYYLRTCRELRTPARPMVWSTSVENTLLQLRAFDRARAIGKFSDGAVALGPEPNAAPRRCRLMLCVDPIALAYAARLEVMFEWLKQQHPDAAVVLDVVFSLAIKAGALRLFAAELSYAGMLSRERPCVMRRSPLLPLLAIDVVAKECGFPSTKKLEEKLQPLIADELVSLETVREGTFLRMHLRRVQTALFHETVDAHVHQKFGSDARRVLALLRKERHLPEAAIVNRALLSGKRVRRAIGELLSADWIRFTEFPKTPEYAPSRTIYVWSPPHGELQRALIRDRAHATLLRMYTRLAAEHVRLDLAGVLAAGLDVRGTASLTRFETPVVAAKVDGDDEEESEGEEEKEDKRRLNECAMWLSRVHRKVYKATTLVYEKLECIEANVNLY